MALFSVIFSINDRQDFSSLFTMYSIAYAEQILKFQSRIFYLPLSSILTISPKQFKMRFLQFMCFLVNILNLPIADKSLIVLFVSAHGCLILYFQSFSLAAYPTDRPSVQRFETKPFDSICDENKLFITVGLLIHENLYLQSQICNTQFMLRIIYYAFVISSIWASEVKLNRPNQQISTNNLLNFRNDKKDSWATLENHMSFRIQFGVEVSSSPAYDQRQQDEIQFNNHAKRKQKSRNQYLTLLESNTITKQIYLISITKVQSIPGYQNLKQSKFLKPAQLMDKIRSLQSNSSTAKPDVSTQDLNWVLIVVLTFSGAVLFIVIIITLKFIKQNCFNNQIAVGDAELSDLQMIVCENIQKSFRSRKDFTQMCCICLDTQACCQFKPCGHAQFCKRCVDFVLSVKKQCSICRSQITKVVYFG